MRLFRVAIVLAAVAAAAVPLPARLVEAWYSRGLYPSIQATVTPISNRVEFALLDIAVCILLFVLMVAFVRRTRSAGIARALVRSLISLMILAATLYLAFLLLWGFNYRRVPLEAKLEFDEARATRTAARTLGELAVRNVNATYDLAHAPVADGPSLEAAFQSAQQLLGALPPAVPGVPKRSLLGFYFRTAAIDGMTNPFFLEVIVNPDALPFERPFITAHEWAHLAGYAHEAEASFVAWLICTQGNGLARYSAWFAIYQHVSAALPRPDRADLAGMLEEGPRRDWLEMSKRYERASPIVRNTAMEVYDRYLKANRVEEGIASYSGVVRLMLGAGVPDGQAPRLRSE
jgi:Protein of unknown function (DUF3810)